MLPQDCSACGSPGSGSCTKACTLEKIGCKTVNGCMDAGGGGGGGGGGNKPSAEEIEFIKECNDALDVANANGDDFIALDEFEMHVQAWITASCPNRDDSGLAQEYHNETDNFALRR